MSYFFTNEGLKVVMDRFANAAPTRAAPTQFSTGTSGTTAAITDTNLGAKIPISGTEAVDNMDVLTGWADNADCTTSLNTTVFINNATAINFTKDGTASVDCYSEKTVTSLDFTSEKLCIYAYIKDAAALAKLGTTGIEVRYGSDSSNYYRFDILTASLTTGWNFISKASSDASATVGSPAIAASDYLRINFKATTTGTTWAAGDFIADYAFLASTDDYYKNYEATYPSLDYTNFEVDVRGRLSSVQGNGHLLREYGSFNQDGTRKLISRANFAGFSKNEDDELIFDEVWTFSNIG